MVSSTTPTGITRRQAIRQTLVFSSSLLLSGWISRLRAQTAFADDGIHLLAFGDFGSQGDAGQQAVATRMAAFARSLNAPLSCVLALGDNFYRELKPERFKIHFEDLYSPQDLSCPFYAIAGNHDYGTASYDYHPGKLAMQLDYARDHPESRWKMPAKWYTVELPDGDGDPLVKMIFLDSNFWPGALTPQEKLAQERFFLDELSKPSRAPWKWVVSHYPMFTEHRSGDNSFLLKRWQPYLRDHNVSLYISGHHHNLQHIEVEGYPTSFVVSGAGGARLYDLAETHRTFAAKAWGFNHLHITRDAFTVQFINAEGRCLHAFRRTLKGDVITPSAPTV